MGKCFCAGIALGMIGGALLVTNSQKARQMVAKSQNEILTKLEQLQKEEEKPSKAPTKKSDN